MIALEKKAKARFVRGPNRPDGTVCVALERENGDRLGATRKSVAAAVAALTQPGLESWPADV